MAYLGTNREVDTEKALMRVMHRLNDDGLLPRESGEGQYSLIPRWFAYAASLLLIIGLGGLGYFWFFGTDSSKLLTLHTGTDNSTFIQTFDDGSIVYMADNSTLDYPEVFNKQQRKVFFTGEAFFDINPKPDQPFIIETQHAIIEVLGTAFNVKSFNNAFELIVEEGYVRVMSKDIPGHFEILGEWEMITGTGLKMEKALVVDRTYLSWRSNRMQFRDEKLEKIASVLTRNYNVNIHFQNDEIKERRLTALFNNSAITTIAEVIAFSMGLEYKIIDDSFIVFSEKN